MRRGQGLALVSCRALLKGCRAMSGPKSSSKSASRRRFHVSSRICPTYFLVTSWSRELLGWPSTAAADAMEVPLNSTGRCAISAAAPRLRSCATTDATKPIKWHPSLSVFSNCFSDAAFPRSSMQPCVLKAANTGLSGVSQTSDLLKVFSVAL